MFAAILGGLVRGGAMLARGGAAAGRGGAAAGRGTSTLGQTTRTINRASMLSNQFGGSERRAETAPAQSNPELGAYTSNPTGAKFYGN